MILLPEEVRLEPRSGEKRGERCSEFKLLHFFPINMSMPASVSTPPVYGPVTITGDLALLWEDYFPNFSAVTTLHKGEVPVLRKKMYIHMKLTCNNFTPRPSATVLSSRVAVSHVWGLSGGSVVKNLPAKQEMQVCPLG